MAKKTLLKEIPAVASGPDSRFEMIKQRHMGTYTQALEQGKVDEQMQPLCSYIARTKGYYTSSCCSGRIMLLEKQGEKKTENFFHRKWHREVTAKEMQEGLEEKVKGELWFKLDPFILHIGCEGMDGAQKILDAMKKAGIKRGGIMLAQQGKYLIEMQGTESMSFPIKLSGKNVADAEYVLKILPKANAMLSKNYKRIERLESEFRKTLK